LKSSSMASSVKDGDTAVRLVQPCTFD
jgi:hypothetical protein